MTDTDTDRAEKRRQERDAKAAAWREQHDAELRQAQLDRKAERADASATWRAEHDADMRFEVESAARQGITVEEFRARVKAAQARMTGKGQIYYSPDHKILNPTKEQKEQR